ncbi:hypothetical protein ABZU75_46035 [Streptosporangium sp. NPDC005286]|uniref:hypothetical protein n=1 Tax=Streptosporangium sp. NPDC005286 TaxID=3154463 RepID=UPI0033A7F39B
MKNRFNPDNDRLVHKADEDVAPEFQEPSAPDADTRAPLPGDRRNVPADLDGDALPRDPAMTPGTPVTGTATYDALDDTAHDAVRDRVPATDSPMTPAFPGSAADRQGDVLDEGASLTGTERADRAPATAETLFDHDSDDVLRRWQEVQAGFVDDPRDAVQRADSLLDEITTSFRNALEVRTTELQGRWKNTEKNDTEDLRTALRGYRTTLEQLLNISAGTR